MCLLLFVCPMLLRGRTNDGLESSKLLEKKWPYNSLRFRLDSTSTVRKAVLQRGGKTNCSKKFSCVETLCTQFLQKALRPISSPSRFVFSFLETLGDSL